MGEVWYPGAERRLAKYGSDNPYLGGGAKVIWHSTESDPGTIEGNLNYAAGVGYGPHIWIDPYTGDCAQTLPLSTPATAVADPAGVGLNRAGSVVVQIEVIGRAHEAPLATSPMRGIAELVGWLRGLGVPDRFPAGVPSGMSGDRSVYKPGSPAGHYTHSQIPSNSHVDPGRIDAGALFGGTNDQEAEMLDEYLEGQNAAQVKYADAGKLGDPPSGKGKYFRAGWNDVRWQANNLAGVDGKDGKDGATGAKGEQGVQGLPGASHSHPKVSVAGPAVSTP